MTMRDPPRFHRDHSTAPMAIILAEKSDYDGGDPDLSLEAREDGLFDFVIYCGTHDLTCHALTKDQVLEAADRIIEAMRALGESAGKAKIGVGIAGHTPSSPQSRVDDDTPSGVSHPDHTDT